MSNYLREIENYYEASPFGTGYHHAGRVAERAAWVAERVAARVAGAGCRAGCGEGLEGVRGGRDTLVFVLEDESRDLRDLRYFAYFNNIIL